MLGGGDKENSYSWRKGPVDRPVSGKLSQRPGKDRQADLCFCSRWFCVGPHMLLSSVNASDLFFSLLSLSSVGLMQVKGTSQQSFL